LTACLALAGSLAPAAAAADWPVWGRDATRNMAAPDEKVVTDFDPGKTVSPDSEEIDLKTTRNVRWVAKLGSQSYGNATVAGGRVYLGTNNDAPHRQIFKDDRSLVLCFDEKSGGFLWQLTVPKLGAGKVSDWEYLGVCSSPAVVGEQVFVVTNRCEVVCLDAQGLRNGNQGMQDEGRYFAGPDAEQPAPVDPQKDADILWVFDMRELGVFPHNITSSSVLVVGDVVFATTSNGKDWTHSNTPNPAAPSLIAIDRKTGKLLGEEISQISQRILHCNWASPALATVKGPGDAQRELVLFGAGDGFLYAFDPKPVRDEKEDLDVLKEVWRVDCNPPHYRVNPASNKPMVYAKGETGPSEIIASPIFHDGLIYVCIGQDPEHGPGWGNLVCVDAATGKVVWSSQAVGRTISTPAVHEGLVYASDYAGFVYCFDAKTGQQHWKHDTQSHIWGSPLLANGQVIIGNEDGLVTVLATGREKKLIREVETGAPIYSSAIAANGVLYIGTQTHLYAIAPVEAPVPAPAP
jgi:outer membrane protein assembly factor BamB